MCGIAGIIDFHSTPIDVGALHRACDTMRHRGPDDRGIWMHRQPPLAIGLAATRLAILDPTPAGHQPMVRGDGERPEEGRYAVVFNGLIYNHRELADELAREGVARVSQCDTEVVLWACARWGVQALSRFNGMWALAFFDSQRRSGFLARDRFGIKPLLYVPGKQRAWFASEMSTLRVLGDWSDGIDHAALLHYLRLGYVAHPQTIYAAARRLSPGEYVRFDPAGMDDPVSYYRPRATPCQTMGDREAAGAHLRNVIGTAVARRTVADVPIGAFLSGGLDSSIVVSHLAQSTHAPVQTFSIGWADERAYDETDYARLVSRHFGTEHHELRCTYREVLDLLPRMLDHLGEPFFDSSILPTALVSQLARRNVTVCLSGDGADELFGGYWRYLAHGVLDKYLKLPHWLRSGAIAPLLRRVGSAKSSRLMNRVRQLKKLLRADDRSRAGGAARGDFGWDTLRRHAMWSRILASEAEAVLCAPAEGEDQVLQRMARDTADMDTADTMNRILAFDLCYALPGDMLHKVDLASMYHSLEVRVPFLDHEVVQAAMAIPSDWKIAGRTGKAILKSAYRGVLPSSVLQRSKAGFEVPIGEFLRDQLRDMFQDVVTRDAIESFGVLDFDSIRRVYDAHCARREEHADLLYALLSLCWWRSRTAGEKSDRSAARGVDC